MNSPEKIEQLKAHIRNTGLGQVEIAEMLKTSQPTVNALINGKKPFGKKVAATWEKTFGVSAAWLLTGEGNMLKGDRSADMDEESRGDAIRGGKLIPLYDAEAVAGNGHIMDMTSARQVGMIEIGTELRDSQSAIRVYGNSMVPTYPAGCLIGLKLWTESFIEPGKVYVIETKAPDSNRFLKRVYYNRDKTAIRCISDNTMKHESGPAMGEYCYPEFEIPMKSILRLHRVVGVIKRNIL